MPRISLTDLVDVVSKAGAPKATKVAQIKNRDEYHPATDFYKQFRDGLVALHKAGLDKSALPGLLAGISEKNRLANYPLAISGYRKWWGKKSLEWFAPPSELYSSSGVEVSVNPELGLRINGGPYVIKLYLKADKLTKNRADLILGLMSEALHPLENGFNVAVLDVRESKFFDANAAPGNFLPLINAELAYVASLWPAV